MKATVERLAYTHKEMEETIERCTTDIIISTSSIGNAILVSYLMDTVDYHYNFEYDFNYYCLYSFYLFILVGSVCLLNFIAIRRYSLKKY